MGQLLFLFKSFALTYSFDQQSVALAGVGVEGRGANVSVLFCFAGQELYMLLCSSYPYKLLELMCQKL